MVLLPNEQYAYLAASSLLNCFKFLMKPEYSSHLQQHEPNQQQVQNHVMVTAAPSAATMPFIATFRQTLITDPETYQTLTGHLTTAIPLNWRQIFRLQPPARSNLNWLST